MSSHPTVAKSEALLLDKKSEALLPDKTLEASLLDEKMTVPRPDDGRDGRNMVWYQEYNRWSVVREDDASSEALDFVSSLFASGDDVKHVANDDRDHFSANDDRLAIITAAIGCFPRELCEMTNDYAEWGARTFSCMHTVQAKMLT